jgi:ABC-2 type transport system ATP-binding protein
MTPGGLVIETHGLSKRFKERLAVDGVDLAVPAGCCFGFLGPNGAGKTTLIRMLLGMTRATAGTIRLRGHEMPSDKTAALSRVGAIVEEPRFVPYLTGRENLRVVASARETVAHDRIDPALARVGLSERADQKVKTYSLGMRQRLGVARCLLADPELLILDEPTNGLDPAGIHEFRQLVRNLVGEGRTVFLSSHLLDEVEKTCDYVAVIDGGRVVQQGAIGAIGAGEQASIPVRIGCDRPSEALALVSSLRHELGVIGLEAVVDGLELELRVPTGDGTGGIEAALATINAALVGAGHGLFRLEVLRQSLEDRFLAVTSRLGDGA